MFVAHLKGEPNSATSVNGRLLADLILMVAEVCYVELLSHYSICCYAVVAGVRDDVVRVCLFLSRVGILCVTIAIWLKCCSDTFLSKYLRFIFCLRYNIFSPIERISCFFR